MPRVAVTNLTKAQQGFYEVQNIAFTESGESAGVVFLKPGERRTLNLSQADYDLHVKHPTMFKFDGVAVDQEAVERQEETEAAAVDPLKTAGGNEAPDVFDDMGDAQLRAFLTDRGQKPHHNAGLEKMKATARGPAPEAGAAAEEETEEEAT